MSGAGGFGLRRGASGTGLIVTATAASTESPSESAAVSLSVAMPKASGAGVSRSSPPEMTALEKSAGLLFAETTTFRPANPPSSSEKTDERGSGGITASSLVTMGAGAAATGLSFTASTEPLMARDDGKDLPSSALIVNENVPAC